MTRAALLAAALALAPRAAHAGDPACEKRVALLDERLSAVVADESVLKGLVVGVPLPRAAHGEIAGDRALVIGLQEDGPTLNGAPMSGTTVADWQQQIEAQSETLRSVKPSKEPPWFYVVVDQGARLERYLPLLTAVGATHELRFVVEPAPSPLARHLPAQVPPGVVRFRERRNAIGDESAAEAERGKLWSREISGAAHGCPTVTRLNEAKALPEAERDRQFVRLLVAMIRDCGCSRVDVDTIEYVSIDMFNGFKPPRRVLRVAFPASGPVLALPTGPVTGQALVTALDRAAKPGHLLRVRVPPR